MKVIPLTQNLFAKVDDSDFNRVSQYKWYAKRTERLIYAARNERINGKRRTMLMHVFLLDQKYIDHRDSDGLNNQRENLRACTHSQNMQNRRGNANSSSRYKGVSKVLVKVRDVSATGKITNYQYLRFFAQITVDGKRRTIGRFKTEIAAAEAFNREAEKAHGEFSKLNKIS